MNVLKKIGKYPIREVIRLRRENKKLRSILGKLLGMIDNLGNRFPEIEEEMARLNLSNGNRSENRADHGVEGDIPEELPTLTSKNEEVVYSTKFIKLYCGLGERERGKVLDSIVFLAKEGLENPKVPRVRLTRKTRGIDTHNCFKINKQKTVIIFQVMDRGIKFRDVFNR